MMDATDTDKDFMDWRLELAHILAQEHAIECCSHAGDCTEDVLATLAISTVGLHFRTLDLGQARAWLLEFGAWESEELTPEKIRELLVWLTACDRKEGNL